MLAELEPRWFGHPGLRMGLTFLCPICREIRLGAAFWPWIVTIPGMTADDITHPPQEMIDKMWTRTSGETFEALSLAPSLNCGGAGHWHGEIVAGEIR